MPNLLKKITVLEGDGIGPEVITQALRVFDRIGKKYHHKFIVSRHLIGAAAIDVTGDPLPDKTIDACLQGDAVLLGAIGDPRFDNDPNATVRPEQGLLRLRKELGLFANVRPVKLFEALSHLSVLKPHVLENVDMVIYRELTGGIYFGEKSRVGNVASDLCKYEAYEIDRIVHLAFAEAGRRRRKLCLIDKANVLDTSRLWRDRVNKIKVEYPEVEVNYLFVDNAAMQMILNPSQFDVIVTSNMFGDIISDEASILGGSLGMLPSSSAGSGTRLYEPVHGSYPQAAGKDIANPMASILSVEMMLRDYNLIEEADDVLAGVEYCIEHGLLTEDLNKENPLKCSEVGNHICNAILEKKVAPDFGVII